LGHHRRFLQLIRLFFSCAFVQASAQGLGLMAGIIIVRSLSKEAYAYFLIVNTIGPMITLLSDLGITNSLSAIGGKIWDKDDKMGSLISTAAQLRKQLFLLSSLVVAPVLIWMLMRNQAPIAVICWVVPITLLSVYFQLHTGVLNVVVNLRQQVKRILVLVVTGSLPRFTLVAVLAAVGLLNVPLAVVAGCVAQGLQLLLLAQWTRSQIAWNAPTDPNIRLSILAIVRQQAPLTLYFCLQSQIGIWLISSFGSVHGVAEVGALGRIGMIFGVLISTTSALIVPRFARCQDGPKLRVWYLQLILGYAALVLSSAALAWKFPQPLTSLLGPKYESLSHLMWLAVISTGSASFTGLTYSLIVNKGWIPPATFVVPIDIFNQLAMCLLFDFSTVEGVLWIGALSPILPGLINLLVGLKKLAGMEAAQKTTY
jgi:O-antigen/teichoic acid export membrane protein